ncbi:MAG: hypothetical protein ACXVJE_15530 [Mucilaginibacter sp.]
MTNWEAVEMKSSIAQFVTCRAGIASYLAMTVRDRPRSVPVSRTASAEIRQNDADHVRKGRA